MGCMSSKIDKEEITEKCKERIKLTKQLVSLRAEFACTQIAYLQSLRNTGATLQQFNEPETLDLEPPRFQQFPSSPPLPPPPPPPPLPFSPELRKFDNNLDDDIDSDEDENFVPLPPPPPLPIYLSGSWKKWDKIAPSTSDFDEKMIASQLIKEDVLTESNIRFEEQCMEVIKHSVANSLSQELAAYTKGANESMKVKVEEKETLAGISRELDDYFLRASSAGKEIGVLLEMNRGNILHQNFTDIKRNYNNKSAKVFSSLSWNWSSKLVQSGRDSAEFLSISEAPKCNGHSGTLDKLYAEEQNLYKQIKTEERIKMQQTKVSLLLEKQETGEQDSTTERLQLHLEDLQTNLCCLQQSIIGISLSISKLRDEELLPQLMELSWGLVKMWRTMSECHQGQNRIALRMINLHNHPNIGSTTNYHHRATIQLEAEVTTWYNSLCQLLKSQGQYLHALCEWVRLTNYLPNCGQKNSSSISDYLCEEIKCILDKLNPKEACEAIQSFASIIHSVVVLQTEEHKLQKKSNLLENKLERKLASLGKMENEYYNKISSTTETNPEISQDHPLSMERVKVDSFKKKVEEEKLKYLNSVQASHSMALNSLQANLPKLFQSLAEFSSDCAYTFESVHKHYTKVISCLEADLSPNQGVITD